MVLENGLTAPLDDFKERELEIIRLMANGLSNAEIADQLFITKDTVRWYNKQIYSKLGTSRRTEAIALARQLGLLEDIQSSPELPHHIEHTLPITTGPFIGRESELVELSGLLRNDDVRLLSLIATGGMGKSRLSLELGHLIKNDFADGAIFIDLTPIRNPDDIAKFTIASLGLTVSDNPSPEDVLLNYCSQKELLIIFDNFEHVLMGANLLSTILEVAPKVKIIATSRERLNLRVETVFYLQPVIEQGEALFFEVATIMRPNLVIEDDEKVSIQRIVDVVGGLPLALILAATWVDTLSISEIADEIEHSLDFLNADMADIPERQRSMQAVIDPTWMRLSEEEQHAFMWVSVFRGGFTREAFQKLTGVSLKTLQNLLSRSLITHGLGRRYDMHPLLRQYAREKLSSLNLLDEAKHDHLQYFLQFTYRQNERMYTGHYLATLAVLDNELDNFRGALDWCLEGNAIDTGIELAIELSEFWETRSYTIEAEQYLTGLLHHQSPKQLQARILCRLGRFQSRMGLTKAVDTLNTALSVAEENSDQESIAWSLYHTEYLEVSPWKSIEKIRHALQLSEALEDDSLIARGHTLLGLRYNHLNESTLAMPHLLQALKIYEGRGDQRGMSVVTFYMGECHDNQGETELALQAYNRSLELKRQIGDRVGTAKRLATIAYRELSQQNYDRVDELLAESHMLLEQLNDPWKLTYTLKIESYRYLFSNQPEQTLSSLIRGTQLLETKFTHFVAQKRLAEFQCLTGWFYLQQADMKPALSHLSQCLHFITSFETREVSLEAMMLVIYGHYFFEIENYEFSTRIATVIYQHRADYEAETLLFDYFLNPLIHKIESRLGHQTWEDMIQHYADVSFTEILNDVVRVLQ